MLKIIPTTQFKRDLKKVAKDPHKNLQDLAEVINMLAMEETLPQKYKDHQLKGDKRNLRECHIYPDWLLIYEKKNDLLVLSLVRTGSHADLFEK